MHRVVSLAVLLLPGCAGTVRVEGDAEPFGPVRSALWVEDDESLLLTNVPDACERFQAYERARLDLLEVLFTLVGREDESVCADLEVSLMDFAFAGSALYYEGATLAEIRLTHAERPLDEGTYPFDGQPLGFRGAIEYVQGERYGAVLDRFDPAASVDDACGVGAEEGLVGDDGVLATWEFLGGDVEITRFTDGERVAGRLDATIADDAGGAASIEGAFTAQWCEIGT